MASKMGHHQGLEFVQTCSLSTFSKPDLKCDTINKHVTALTQKNQRNHRSRVSRQPLPLDFLQNPLFPDANLELLMAIMNHESWQNHKRVCGWANAQLKDGAFPSPTARETFSHNMSHPGIHYMQILLVSFNYYIYNNPTLNLSPKLLSNWKTKVPKFSGSIHKFVETKISGWFVESCCMTGDFIDAVHS